MLDDDESGMLHGQHVLYSTSRSNGQDLLEVCFHLQDREVTQTWLKWRNENLQTRWKWWLWWDKQEENEKKKQNELSKCQI